MADDEFDGDDLPEELDVQAPSEEEEEGCDSQQSSAEGSVTGKTTRGRAKSKAQPKSRARGKGSNRLKVINDKGKSRNRVTKDGKKYCPACGKMLPVTEFPAGSGQCAKDRKAIQVLRNCAVSQNQLEWWEETTRDPKKLKKVVASYHARAPPPGKKRKEQFNILQYIEERRQESAVIFDGVMEMMSEQMYVAWMAKPKNGGMDPLEAAAEWKTLYSTPGAITDDLGRNPKYKERVAVKKTDLVKFRDASIRSQVYSIKDKEQKKATQADIDRAEARLSKDASFLSTNVRGRVDQAAAMVEMASSAGNDGGAFSSEGKAALHVGNVKDLLSEDEAEMDEGGDESDAGMTPSATASDNVTPKKKRDGDMDSLVSGSDKKPTKKPKKETWFDRDGVVASALKVHQTWMNNTKAAITTTIQGLKEALEKSNDFAEDVKNEARLAQNRLQALRLISGDKCTQDGEPEEAESSALAAPAPAAPDAQPAGPAAPADASQQVESKDSAKEGDKDDGVKGSGSDQPAEKEQEKAPPADSASSFERFVRSSSFNAKKALRKYIASFSTDDKKPLGSAPPCRSYQSLVVFAEFEEKLAEIEAAQTKERLVQIQNDMKPFKTAYADLLSMAKAAKSRLVSATQDAAKQQQKRKDEQDQVAQAKRKPGRPRKENTAAETMVAAPNSVATDIESIVIKEDGKPASDLNLELPLIFRMDPKQVAEFAAVKTATLAVLEQKFKNDPARTSTGRSQRALPPDQKSSIVDFVHKLFPEGHILESAKIPDKIKNELLVPAASIVAKSWVTASAEAGHLPTCRVGFGGTRAVVAVRTSNLLEHVSQGGGGKADLARCYQWLKSASKEAAKAFVDANPTSKVLFHATVGPNDILFLPAGWMFYECISNGGNFLGVRVQYLSLSSLAQLHHLNSYLLSLGKPNAALQSAVDCLSLAEA